MSHFSVAVFHRQDEDIAKILQPYHEFECTGTDDQYVVDVDITEDVINDYRNGTSSRIRDEDGKLHDRYDDAFYRDPTNEEADKIGQTLGGSGIVGGTLYRSKDWGDGRGRRLMVHHIPDGYAEVEVPYCEVMSLRDYVENNYKYNTKDGPNGGKHGYIELNGCGDVVKVVKRTNPNSRWDWWTVGGRYSGSFECLNPYDDPRNKKSCWLCGGTGIRRDDIGDAQRKIDPTYTCNGCNGTGRMLKHASEFVDEGNYITIENLRAIEPQLKQHAESERKKRIDDIAQKTSLSWEEIERALHLKAVTDEEWKTLEPRPRGAEYYAWLEGKGGGHVFLAKVMREYFMSIPDVRGNQTIGQWICEAPYFTCFALIRNGEWHESGSMGWWGTVSNEKDVDEWQRFVNKTIEECDDDMMITVVDCHI